MTPYDIAKSYIGLTEGPGPENNPVILEMYATVGQDWVEHDSVAWCAAFVGHCLEQAGIRSTRKLTARSYLDWGVPVDIADAKPGDIGVIPRGSSSWQGHVFFVDRIEGGWIWGLGGNQSDAVNVRRYPSSKLLGIRRAGHVSPAARLSVRQVQKRLKDLGYHEVGVPDGLLGPRTRGAILAFRDDHALPLLPIIDVALEEAMVAAEPRPVAPERAEGMPKRSRILAASDAQIGVGLFGVVGTVTAQAAPILSDAEAAQDGVARFFDLLSLNDRLSGLAPWIGLLCFVVLIISAVHARHARIEDHRSGRTM